LGWSDLIISGIFVGIGIIILKLGTYKYI